MKIIHARLERNPPGRHTSEDPLGQGGYRAVLGIKSQGSEFIGASRHSTPDAAVFGAFEDAAAQAVAALRSTLDVSTMVLF